MTKTLTQTEIIQSLGKALEWYERELSWGTPISELNHLTGRIGELYVAMISRGQMALASKQRGYDVVSDAERISVKTVTTSTHLRIRNATLPLVDRIVILRLSSDDDHGLSIEEVDDFPSSEIAVKARRAGEDWVYTFTRPKQLPDVSGLQITDDAWHNDFHVRRYENGTIRVMRNGHEFDVTKPALRQIAEEIGIDLLNRQGNPKNVRQLGTDIITALKALAE